MPYPDAQAIEAVAAELFNNVPQAVVPAVPATLLEPHHARLEIDFIVNDHDLFNGDPVVVGDGANRLAAPVHEGLRLAKPAVHAVRLQAADLRIERGLRAKRQGVFSGQEIDEPESRVVPGPGVFRARISEAHDKLDGRWHAVPAGLDWNLSQNGCPPGAA